MGYLYNKTPHDTFQMNWAAPSENKTRVVVFGSFYRGYHILKNLLSDKELMKRIEIVGVATDDPHQSYVSPQKRVWQYPHTEQEEQMVEKLAEKHGIPVFKGKVKSKEFYDIIENDWKPDIAYMGTFGQLLNNRIIDASANGIYNCHPSDGENWPSCVGPDPFEQIFESGKRFCGITLHQTNDKFDDGELTCFSERIPVPYEFMEDQEMHIGERVIHMHRLTSPHAGQLVNAHLRSQLDMPLTRMQDQYKDAFKDPNKSHADNIHLDSNGIDARYRL